MQKRHFTAKANGSYDTIIPVENGCTRKELCGRRKVLQKWINDELMGILNMEVQKGLPMLNDLLKDNRVVELTGLMDHMKSWSGSLSKQKMKTFMMRSKIQSHFGKMLDNRLHQPYLERVIERFEAENEIIVSETRNRRLTIKNPDQHNAPLHYAVRSLNIAFVEWLLKRTNIEVNIRNKQGKTPLFMLCEQYADCTELDKLENIRRCITLLIQHGADFNICSIQPMLPFGLLLRNTSKESVKFVDDCVKSFGSGIIINRDKTLETYQPEDNVNVTVELLEIFLRFKEYDKFCKEFERFTINESNMGKVIKLLLFVAIELGLQEYVNKIVECAGQKIFKAAKMVKDGNKTIEMVHREHLRGLLSKTCQRGNIDTLRLLLQNINDHELLNNEPILVITLNTARNMHKSKLRSRLLECAELLAKDKRIIPNAMDPNGKQALHLAVRYGFTEIALCFLRKREFFLGTDKNKVLNYATYDFWKLYFDQCTKPLDLDRNEIKFNLSCLNPFASEKCHTATKKQNNWKTSKVSEIDVVNAISESEEHERLLLHPIIYTFVMVKWLRVAQWCYLNFLCILVTSICFGWYTFEQCHDENPSIELALLTWAGSIYLIGREVMQILIIRWNYLWSWPNLLDIATVFSMTAILMTGCNPLHSSLTVLALALQITNLIGLLPFNLLSVYTDMFRTVSVNFIKSFLLFVPLLTAFTYCFFLTPRTDSFEDDETAFHSFPRNIASEQLNVSPDNSSENVSSLNKLTYFSNAALNTIVMTTGGLETSSHKFDQGRIILLMLFIFFGPLVLQNLINGLAITDITSMRQKSELISVQKKVSLLQHYEQGSVRIWPRRAQKNSFFRSHYSVIVVKPHESHKVLVQPKGSTAKDSCFALLPKPKKTIVQKDQNNRKEKSFQGSVVSKLPGGLFGGEGLSIKYFKFPLFLTLDKQMMDKTLRVVDGHMKKGRNKT